MARRLPDRVFDPSKPLVVVKSFIANGRHYTQGQDFLWKQKSLDQRRVRQMFDARVVDFKDAKVSDKPISKPVKTPTESTKALSKNSKPKSANS